MLIFSFFVNIRVISLLGIAPEEEKEKNQKRAGDGGKNNNPNEKQRNSELFSRSDFSHLKKLSNTSISTNTDIHGNSNTNKEISKEINGANKDIIIAALNRFMAALSFYLKFHRCGGKIFLYLQK